MKKLYMLSFSLLTLFSQSFSLVARHANAIDCRDINYRIEKHLQLINTLNTLSKRGILRSEIIKSKKSACGNCSHELIKLCMKKMEQDTCLDPVLETWKLFNTSYSEIETELFLQEFSSMVCAVSREYVSALSSLPINIRKQKENKPDTSSSLSLEGENAPILLSTVSLQEIFNLYIKIAKLPIAEILERLDELYDALRDLMDEYGLQQEQTWMEWLKVNWWIPPVAITCMVLVFAKKSNPKIVTDLLFDTARMTKSRANQALG